MPSGAAQTRIDLSKYDTSRLEAEAREFEKSHLWQAMCAMLGYYQRDVLRLGMAPGLADPYPAEHRGAYNAFARATMMLKDIQSDLRKYAGAGE